MTCPRHPSGECGDGCPGCACCFASSDAPPERAQMLQRMPDGSYQPAQPLGWQGSGPDFEVYNNRKPMEWVAYDEDVCVATGTARTRPGLYFALWRARRRLTR